MCFFMLSTYDIKRNECQYFFSNKLKLLKKMDLMYIYHNNENSTPVEEKRLTLVWRSHSPFKTHQKI